MQTSTTINRLGSVHRRLGRRALVVLAAAAALAGTLAASAHGSRPGHPGAAPGPAVDLALGASATASSAATSGPAASAVDGNAGTSWCATQWTGDVVVDLGTVRTLSGAGVTLASTASPSTASIALGTAAGSWHPVNAAQNIALNGSTPSYIALPTGQHARYAKLTVTTGDGSPACVGEFRLFGHDADTDSMMLGSDLSFEPQELAAGTKFTDQGHTSTAVQILRAHGGNYVRMRLWVNPPAGYSDLATDLALARRVQAAGMRVYLDIHYSDFWADPQHEDTPAAWQGQDLATLAATVQSYTRSVISAFARQRTPVAMVSIGNEIRNGMLWPTGQVDWTANTGWDNLATLLKAGVAGARAANPPHNPLRVMLHFDQGGDNAQSYTFFHNLVTRGVPFDVIGLSYYPFWHGTLSDLRNNVDKLATQFGKDIVVAETQYGWTLANGDTTGNSLWQANQLAAGYPASPGGQLSLENDVLSILAAIPGGHGAGLFYWEPEWVPGVGWEPGAGSPNDNLTLYDFQGRTLPSIGLLEDPVTVCQRYDHFGVPCVVPG